MNVFNNNKKRKIGNVWICCGYLNSVVMVMCLCIQYMTHSGKRYLAEFLISFEVWAKLTQKWLVCAPLRIHLEPINKELCC